MIRAYINNHLNVCVRPDLTISVESQSDPLGCTLSLISQPITREVLEVLTEALAKSIAALDLYEQEMLQAKEEGDE